MYALQSFDWLAFFSHVLHIADWKPQNRRERRRLTYIMQYRLTVKYTRGVKNVTPDCLSRLFQDASVEERRANDDA